MKTKNKTLVRDIVQTLMLLIMMGWGSRALAASDPIVAKWNFASGTYTLQTVQKNTLTLTANEGEKLDLFVDATAGKFSIDPSKKRSVVNTGTKIRVPVLSTKDVLEIQVNDGGNRTKDFFYIDGVQLTEATTTYRAKSEDVERGYVEIEAIQTPTTNSNSYIYYISITQYPPVYEEKCLYSTDFQNWTKQSPAVPAVDVKKTTIDGQDLTFSLNNTQVDPTGSNAKFTETSCITKGYVRGEKNTDATAKEKDPYIQTSVLKSVTKIKFVQAATGGKRGWGLKVKGDGDSDWVPLYTDFIGNGKGEQREITVNRKNVQLCFYSLTPDQNAFMTSLEIYGNMEVKEDVNVTYYDADGTTVLDKETIPASEPLTFKEGVENLVTVPSGSKFRGWFDGQGVNAEKMLAGSELSVDLNLYAKVTPIEEATDGSYYAYDLTKKNFYQEDHELVSMDGGEWKDNKHGWIFTNGGTVKLQVAKNAHIYMTLCDQSNVGTITITDANGQTVGSTAAKATSDGTAYEFDYKGAAPTTLTFNMSVSAYLHSLSVRNYIPVYVKFDFSDKNLQGSKPEDILCEALTGKATMPDHVLLSRDGWTFVGWTDGTNIYEPGETYNFTENVTLKPKMALNDIHLYDTNSPIEVVWPFDHRKAPAISLDKNSAVKILPYTKTVSIEGKTQDVTMLMDVTNGTNSKIVNTDSRINSLSGGAEGAQVNNSTVFTIPAVYGMNITIHASDKVDGTSSNNETFFGTGTDDAVVEISDADGYVVSADDMKVVDKKTLSFTYKGDATKAKITIVRSGSNNQWGFFKDITATYPVLPDVKFVKSITNADPDKFPNEKAENAGDITVKLKDVDPTSRKNIGSRYKVGDVVTVSVTPNYGYNLTDIKIKDASQKSPLEYTITAEDNTIEVVYTRKTMHKVVVTPSDVKQGSVTLEPNYVNFYNETRSKDGTVTQVESWYEENTPVTATAEAAINYMLGFWSDGVNKLSENNPYKFTVGTTDQAIIANFTLGNVGSVVFKIPDGEVDGASDDFKGSYSITPDALNNVRSFVIPTDYTFYSSKANSKDADGNGRTLQYWIEEGSDGQNQYQPGKVYSFKTLHQTLTLVPVFADNPYSHLNRTREALLRYDFARNVHEYLDPVWAETHQVCAQSVDIDHGQKPFWTTQVKIETLEDGEKQTHIRDAALWCDTGKNGYIRNTDLDEWCAFGPGTTFWLPAGAGTKISMLTYAPITTTTFDGKVPTLDEERTKQEREKWGSQKMYVYTYTTNNTAARVPVVIGDDYSYYRWMEVSILAANMVNLHASVDDDVRGEISEIKSESEFGAQPLEDGGYAFHQGDKVKMTIARKFGFELDKIVDPNKTDKDGNPLAVLKMNDDGTVDMVGLNDATTTSKVEPNADGTWGVASGDNKTVFVLKKIEPTTEELKNGARTSYEVEFEITTHRTLQVCFKEKPTYYITYNGGEFAEGTPPEVLWLEAGDPFTIATNKTLYYEGNTLDHWVDDQDNVYNIQQEYSAPAKDLRLFPVFVANSFNILDLQADATATWNFAKDDGAPTINYEGTKGILVTQLKSGDKSIDLKIDLDGTKGGKFNNTSDRTERIQINGKSIIWFTATPKCVVKLVTTDKEKANCLKIENTTVSVANSMAQVTCEATDNSNLSANFLDGAYSKSFSVTYKKQTAVKSAIETMTCGSVTYNATQIAQQMADKQCVTFKVSPWSNANETMPDVTGTATENGTVSATKATVSTPECVVTVKTKSGITVQSYPVKFEFETPTTVPAFVKAVVNGTEYESVSGNISNVPQSGSLKFVFNRTMKDATLQIGDKTYSASSGKELVFKYWDLPIGSTVTISVPKGTFSDIYGSTCQQELSFTLNITDNHDNFHHHPFDFVVGKDGTIDEAIEAANNNTKVNNHRYFIFVPDGDYQLSGNGAVKAPDGTDNGVTRISKSNISLIGQSKQGVRLWNRPKVAGISSSATLFVNSGVKDFYSQDLTLEDTFDYWDAIRKNEAESDQKKWLATQAVTFWDKGDRSIMKNVALLSWQDTYYSNNATPDSRGGYRGYFENCDFYGVVDFLCGDGNIWLEKCNILLRDRSGNNIVAPSTQVDQNWGYVFNNCSIKSESAHPTQLAGKDWTLSRPWNDSPACTFLNTMMYTQPRNYGWGRMGTGMVIRFHEYNSMDDGGNPLSLGTRSLAACTPAPHSDECVLNETQAAAYTIRNVVGGLDAFEPNEFCRQIDAASSAVADRDANDVIWDDGLLIDDDMLQWNADERALCYVVFKRDDNGKWIYLENTTDNSVNLAVYGSGYYCVRAANQRGGLGAATKAILYTVLDPYDLDIKQTGSMTEDGQPYGWTTICLPFNAKVPSEVTVYAATAHNKETAEDKVVDYKMTLTPVEVIDSLKGYVVYGPVGTHSFRPTTRVCDKVTILEGNPTKNAISATNINCYVLAYKKWDLGFYKFNGQTLAAYRAWLPQSMVGENVQLGLSAGTNSISFFFADGSTPVKGLHYSVTSRPAAVYNLKGEQVATPSLPGVYIIQGKGKVLKK